MAIAVCLVSCFQAQEQPPKFKPKHFVWSAYTWIWNDTTRQHQFYLGHYVEINPNGDCFIMRHDTFRGQPTYYRTRLKDALLNRMNQTFGKEIDSTRYWQSRADSMIIQEYDRAEGSRFYHCFDYVTPGNKPQLMKYHRKFLGHYLTEDLYQMHFQLEKIAYNPRLVKLTQRPDNPQYEGYAVRLRDRLNEKIPPIEEMSSKTRRFIPPPPIE